MADLRANGIAVTTFARQIDPGDTLAWAEAIDTIQQHHPGETVWTETENSVVD